MQELNYLKDKIITPGAAPFVSHATYPVNDGHADLWLYDIFPGVQTSGSMIFFRAYS